MDEARFGTEGINSLLLRFSTPMILYVLLCELYVSADTYFVSYAIGPDGIGALAITYPILRFMMALSVLISMGTSSCLSRSLGNNDMASSRKVLGNGFILTLLPAVSVTLIIFFARYNILRLLGARGNILTLSYDYLGHIILGNIFLCLTIFISDVIFALGENRIGVIATSIGVFSNMALDYIFVVHMNMGIKAIALTTAGAQLLGFLYAYYNYIRLTRGFKASYTFKGDKRIMISIILIGLSAFLTELQDGILIGVLNSLLLNLKGNMGVVILGIISKIYIFLYMIVLGIGAAMQPIAAYNIGSKDYTRLKAIIIKFTSYCLVNTLILWGFSMLLAPKLIGMFTDDRIILKEAVFAFRLMIAVFPIISLHYMSISYFQARGKARISIILSVMRQLVFIIPIAFILSKGFNLGIKGVWISYPISDILSCILTLILLKNEGKKLGLMAAK